MNSNRFWTFQKHYFLCRHHHHHHQHHHHLSAWTTSLKAQPVSLSTPWRPRQPSPTWFTDRWKQNMNLRRTTMKNPVFSISTWLSWRCKEHLGLHAKSFCRRSPGKYIFVFSQNLLVYFYRESKNPKLKRRLTLFCSVQPVLQARQMSNWNGGWQWQCPHLAKFEGCSKRGSLVHPLLQEFDDDDSRSWFWSSWWCYW